MAKGFNKGDKVRCISTGGNNGLTAGAIYEVIGSGSTFTTVMGDHGVKRTVYHSRFELVKDDVVGSTNKILVGQRVSVKAELKRPEGVVVEVVGRRVLVDHIGWRFGHDGDGSKGYDYQGMWYYDCSDLQVVDGAKARFIIIVENADGKLAPALTPKEYGSLEQAEKVALEMSEKYEGKFYVFKSVSHAEPVVIKKTEAKLVGGY